MNKRTTLGPLDNQFNSQIPLSQPNFSKNRFSIGRPSLGGQALRNASQQMNGLAGDMNQMSLSQSRQSVGYRHSMAPAGRRSSVAQSRVSLMTMPAQQMKDPRMIRDKKWMLKAVHLLISFITETGFQEMASPKIWNSPSTKDFQKIFKYLYERLDPGFNWKNKKFEEEVPILLKSLKYPFAESVSKSSIISCYSQHAWPVCLAGLVWMVELILAMEHLEQDDEQDEMLNKTPDRVFFDFITNAYCDYMAGVDDSELENDLEKVFKEKDELMIKEIKRLELENEKLEKEFNKLTSQPSPLIQLSEEYRVYNEDIEKVVKWSETLALKMNQLNEQMDDLKKEESEVNEELQKVNQEKNRLQLIVDNQEISPADVDRMNAEKEQLTNHIQKVGEQTEEMNKNIWENEISCHKKREEVEKLALEFRNRAYRLELIPQNAKNAEGMNFDLKLNAHAVRAEQMVSLDLKGQIKQALNALRSRFKNLKIQTEGQYMATKEIYDRVSEEVNEKLDEIQQIELKIQTLVEQYETEKETWTVDIKNKSDEAEQIDRELRRSKVEGTRGLFDAQKMNRDQVIEMDNLQRRTKEQKEKVLKEALKALDLIVEFKSKISRDLNGLQKAVANELKEEKEKLLAFRKELEQKMTASFYEKTASNSNAQSRDPSFAKLEEEMILDTQLERTHVSQMDLNSSSNEDVLDKLE